MDAEYRLRLSSTSGLCESGGLTGTNSMIGAGGARMINTGLTRSLSACPSLALSSSDRLRSGCGVALEQIGKMGKWGEGVVWLTARPRFVRPATNLITLMLIVVTVEAEQLPVAAVRRIVVMVVVLVMDRELVQLLSLKFAPAVGTDPGK
jgi:hypothetical protein